MPTTLGELIQEANRASGGMFPSQQVAPKASVIEDVLEENPYLSSSMDKRSKHPYDSSAIFGENTNMFKGNRTPIVPSQEWQQNNQTMRSPALINALSNETRGISLDEAVSREGRRLTPVSMLSEPQIAGSTPPMRSFSKQPIVPMRIKEKFSRGMGGQTCIDTLNHISSCPVCSRYFQCDTKVYHVIIFMLIVLFITILYFITEKNRN